MTASSCPDCGAVWQDEMTCESAFHQFLYWEHEGGDTHRTVHHLLVLCYHMQHPRLLSADWLVMAKSLLIDFVVKGISPQTIRELHGDEVNSSHRKWKIKATEENYGRYDPPITWTVTSSDIHDGGMDQYPDQIRRWSQAILADLRQAGQI